MRIVQINITYRIGSTGRIMADLDEALRKTGHKSYMVSGYTGVKAPENLFVTERLPNLMAQRKNIGISRLTGRMGYRRKNATRRMVEWIKSKNPELIHLHNIHGNFLNLDILFNYLKQAGIPVLWTLHDCWSFTGRCSYFDLFGCDRWQTGCYGCKNRKIYPITYFFDFSKQMWLDKKALFTSVPDMMLLPVSRWLNDYVEHSFLNQYPIKVMYNGIDTDVFCPDSETSVKETQAIRNQFNGKKILLGVAISWAKRKGLYDFYELDKKLDHEKYQLILIGLNSKQLKEAPSTIVAMGRTNNVDELIRYYRAADVFINLTYQETFGMTSAEALACGTPVVTYRAGGTPECVSDTVGAIVERGNVQEALAAALSLCEQKDILSESCVRHIRENFDTKLVLARFIDLYKERIAEHNKNS